MQGYKFQPAFQWGNPLESLRSASGPQQVSSYRGGSAPRLRGAGKVEERPEANSIMEEELRALLLPLFLPPLRCLGRPRGRGCTSRRLEQVLFQCTRHQREVGVGGAVFMLTKATSHPQDQWLQNARPQQMLKTALILVLERKRRLVHGSLFEWCQSLSCQERQAYLLLSLPIQHRGSCPNAHVQIVFMTVLRRSDRAF